MSQATSFDPYALPHDALVEPPATLWQALRKIGPGIILAGSIIGSGELILTTSLGAKEGYICMWLILFSCVIKVFVQVELGRNAISSGMPTLGALNSLPGPKLGAHWLVWWWLIMLMCTVSQLGAMAGGTGQALHIAFPVLSDSIVSSLSSDRQAATLATYEAAFKADPANQEIANKLARYLATAPDASLRDGKRAVELATQLCEATSYKQAALLSTLAASDAESGDYDSAIKWIKQIIQDGGEKAQVNFEPVLKSYEGHRPWRELNLVSADGEKPDSLGLSLASAVFAKPEKPWTILLGILAIAMLLSGGYKRVERITTLLVAGVTLLTVTCVLALPATDFPIDWKETFLGLKPVIPAAGIALAFAVFGITGVGASELYSYPYWCLEKGYARWAGPQTSDEDWARRARGWIRVMNLDAWVSMLVFTVATVSFYLMGAAVLHPQKLDPKGADMIRTLSEMYVGPFGQWTQVVFLIGAGVVLFKTLYVSAASHSRLTTDFLSLAGFVKYPGPEKRARFIRGFCVFYPCFAVSLYLFFGEPKAMVIFGGFFQALTLPVITGATIYLRYFRTDKRLAPTKATDVCLWFAFITIAAVACYAVPEAFETKVLPLLRDVFAATKGS
jgi:Mn2+/Fe2+ NRAMP family transporter